MDAELYSCHGVPQVLYGGGLPSKNLSGGRDSLSVVKEVVAFAGGLEPWMGLFKHMRRFGWARVGVVVGSGQTNAVLFNAALKAAVVRSLYYI